MGELRNVIKDLTRSISSDRNVLEDAYKHATDLKLNSMQLQNNFQDTKQFAATSLTAGARYLEIAGAINDAFRAAKSANDTADKANREVCVSIFIVSRKYFSKLV